MDSIGAVVHSCTSSSPTSPSPLTACCKLFLIVASQDTPCCCTVHPVANHSSRNPGPLDLTKVCRRPICLWPDYKSLHESSHVAWFKTRDKFEGHGEILLNQSLVLQLKRFGNLRKKNVTPWDFEKVIQFININRTFQKQFFFSILELVSF